MNTGLFISLLNPSISVVLACGFHLLWRYQKNRRYLAILALAYAGSAAGFLLQQFLLPIGLAPTKLFSCTVFVLAAICMSSAVVARFGRRVPIVPFLVLGLGGLASFSWFMFVDNDLSWRIFSINFALGGISLIVAVELRAIARNGPVERILFALALLSGLNFLARPILAIALSGPYQSYDGFYTSLYWTTSVLSHAVLSLLIALTLFTAEALDLFKDLRSETLTDPLSGLFNRRGFEVRSKMLLQQCAKGKLPVAVVVADLDRFKELNDRHGHAAGDLVIIEFSSRLRVAAGARGVAGRLGGEEFAVLLPLADPAAARLLAEAVRSVFSTEAIDGLPPEVRVTASFGVAGRCGGEGLDSLMRRADEALYHAKKGGRDRVRVSYERLPEMVPSNAGLKIA